MKNIRAEKTEKGRNCCYLSCLKCTCCTLQTGTRWEEMRGEVRSEGRGGKISGMKTRRWDEMREGMKEREREQRRRNGTASMALSFKAHTWAQCNRVYVCVCWWVYSSLLRHVWSKLVNRLCLLMWSNKALVCVSVCVCVWRGGGGGSYTWPYEKIAFILKQFCLDKWLFVCLNIPFHKRSSLFRFVVSLAQREPDNSWPCLLSGLIVNNDVCHSKESYIFIYFFVNSQNALHLPSSIRLSVCLSVGRSSFYFCIIVSIIL